MFASLFNGGSTLKGKNLVLLELILSFKCLSLFGRLVSSSKVYRKSHKVFLVKPVYRKNSKYWDMYV